MEHSEPALSSLVLLSKYPFVASFLTYTNSQSIKQKNISKI